MLPPFTGDHSEVIHKVTLYHAIMCQLYGTNWAHLPVAIEAKPHIWQKVESLSRYQRFAMDGFVTALRFKSNQPPLLSRSNSV